MLMAGVGALLGAEWPPGTPELRERGVHVGREHPRLVPGQGRCWRGPYSSLLSEWVPGPCFKACLLRGPVVVAVAPSTGPALGFRLSNVAL